MQSAQHTGALADPCKTHYGLLEESYGLMPVVGSSACLTPPQTQTLSLLQPFLVELVIDLLEHLDEVVMALGFVPDRFPVPHQEHRHPRRQQGPNLNTPDRPL